MRVMEIFYSIQGEGKYLGVPVVFIRTSGCSLKCPFCDTKASWEEKGQDVDADYILRDIMRANQGRTSTIVITGGEPTEQPDLYTIVERLKYEQFNVHLETNGTNDIMRGYFTHVACSPKPGTGFQVPKGVDELKYVVGVDDDLNKMIPGPVRTQFAGRIWLQPRANNEAVPSANVQYCIKQALLDPRLRVGIQYHKYIGVQ